VIEGCSNRKEMKIILNFLNFILECNFNYLFGGNMFKRLFLSLFSTIILLSSLGVSAHPVTVETGGYDGIWKIAGVKYTGIQTLELPEGSHSIDIGLHDSILFDIDVNGIITVVTPDSATSNSGNITFLTTPVYFDLGEYDSYFNMTDVYLLWESQTRHMVKGIDYIIRVGAARSLSFSINGDGTIINNSPISLIINGDSIMYKTSPVTINTNGYSGMYIVFGAMLNYAMTDKTIHLIHGINYNFVIATKAISIELNDSGDEILSSSSSITINGTDISLNTIPVQFDPQLYGGSWRLTRATENHFNYGPLNFNLVVGITYEMIIANSNNTTMISVGDDGSLSGIGSDSFYYMDTTLVFRNSPIIIDNNNYSGGWAFSYVQSGYNQEPMEFILVPDQRYNIWPLFHVSTFFNVDSDGTVAQYNENIYTGEGSTLQFNTATITFNTSSESTRWSLNGSYLGVYTGSQELTLLLGINYSLTNRTNPVTNTESISLMAPCAVVPGSITVGEELFSFSCELPNLDVDGDGIPDESDNCPEISNPDQLDSDIDYIGDLCDNDMDGDTINNEIDNCPLFPNENQSDLDADGEGDACDNDTDGDAVPDEEDNCILIPNTSQVDNDSDQMGDACDTDDDNDTIEDTVDNCPAVANTDQADFDQDGEGDSCDGDTDADGIANEYDICPETPTTTDVNSEGCNAYQYVALNCNPASFTIHGHYVSCVAHAANELADLGLISSKEKSRLVRAAAKK
jgi:Thrombospondin type 3 repeat